MRAGNRSFRPVTKLPGTVVRRHMADCPRHALAGCRSPSRSHGERKVTSHSLRACRGHRICRAASPGACGCLLRRVSRPMLPGGSRRRQIAESVRCSYPQVVILPPRRSGSVAPGVTLDCPKAKTGAVEGCGSPLRRCSPPLRWPPATGSTNPPPAAQRRGRRSSATGPPTPRRDGVPGIGNLMEYFAF